MALMLIGDEKFNSEYFERAPKHQQKYYPAYRYAYTMCWRLWRRCFADLDWGGFAERINAYDFGLVIRIIWFRAMKILDYFLRYFYKSRAKATLNRKPHSVLLV